MDRNSILGFVLIGVIVTVWLFYTSVNKVDEPAPAKGKKTELVDTAKAIAEKRDSVAVKKAVTDSTIIDSLSASLNKDSLMTVEKFGEYFAKFSKGTEDTITIENDLVIAKISLKGAAIVEWTLKKYNKWDGVPAQLIRNELGATYYMAFDTRDDKAIDTRDLYFSAIDVKKNYKISHKDSLTLTFRLPMGADQEIIRTYTFFGDSYMMMTDFTIKNMNEYMKPIGYTVNWDNGLKYQEFRSDLESGEAHAMVVKNDEPEELDASGSDPVKFEAPIDGFIDFAAIKTKYFVAAFIPYPKNAFEVKVNATGKRFALPDKGVLESYDMKIKMPYKGGIVKSTFRVYIGPLEYDEVHKYGLQRTISFGWWLFRLIGEFLLLPFIKLISSFVPNFGISIIIFSIFIKFILYPFSITQLKSSQKMQLINPEIAKIREKYKDDQKAQQQETMKIYGQYGINPASGCLPLLLQMPILIALWKVLNSAIDLRQAAFLPFWLTDLSLPDYVIHFPFAIIGITDLSGLAILMGITMFIQQKMTITDPRQKMMIYMMPIMFTLMFSNLPSGLNLYYFMFNILSIGQQVYMNKFSKNRLTLEDLKKSPKKEGWLQKKMREAQEVAQSQGKNVPGTPYTSSKSKNQRKKPK
jgi:YidC/Oxa1 family membrane protein insertase